MAEFPEPETWVGHPEHPIYRTGLFKQSTADHLKAATLPENYPQIQQLMKHYDIQCLSITEPSYPAALKEIYAPPMLLYARGNLSLALESTCLAVVGTRKTSAYG
ncbi:MAG TPA: DNA-processing protein DprA, partial [Candidatus Cloacimonadota bacterium]|nr:DNA-processing protein DprA [Candidatus Cloacimonadota bacterium]